MEKLSIKNICDITHGTIIQKGQVPWVQGAVIDSRKVHDGDLYIPIVGVKNDGHQFIESAVTNGASAVLIDAGHLSFIKQANDAGVIQVESTIEALKQIPCAKSPKRPS